MHRPCLSHPVCFQSPCAHRCARGWLQDVVRGREHRSGRVLCTWVASMARLVGLVPLGSIACVLLLPFYHRRGPLSVDFGLDKAGVQRVVERQCAASSGLGELGLYVSCTACWSQVEWRACAHVVSDGVRHLVRALVRACYVTDVTNFTGRGDIFPEHERHVSVILMIVVKYLMGQFFPNDQISSCEHVCSP